jgi:UDP-2-acetamido-3-amino-2,3-dideoxy-glucuronate N-acetyltransferase
MTVDYFVHETSVVDEPAQIGTNTRIWHFSHVMAGAAIGSNCVLGQNVFVAGTARLGDHVHVQNNVSIYDGVVLEDNVFCGPSVVFTNVINPRSAFPRKNAFEKTIVQPGATLGANATVLCGRVLGPHCFVGAGAVVTHDVPAFALVLGTPGRCVGWMSRYGERLHFNRQGIARCPTTGDVYRLVTPDRVSLAEKGTPDAIERPAPCA